MSFSFSSMIRLIVVMALGMTMLAIGVSRLDPPRPGWRSRLATKFVNLNEYFTDLSDRMPRWLDVETGRVVATQLDDGDVLEAASCSPWADQSGQRQVAGRWSSRTMRGPMSISTDFGLARYTFPGGQLLDHVSTDIVPVGPPCWFPGTRARILFAGGDGQLYHYAFETESRVKASEGTPTRDARPVALKWRCPRPGLGKVFLGDLTWPEDPSLKGYVVVSLRVQSPDSNLLRSFTGTTLWWLKLDVAGTEIVEAGRLLLPDGGPRAEGGLDQRSPTVGTLADGTRAVAYLAEVQGKHTWDLRIAPIRLEGDHQLPRAHESSGVVLATGCQPAHPCFSADGRWLHAVAESGQPGSRLIRLPLSGVFPRPG